MEPASIGGHLESWSLSLWQDTRHSLPIIVMWWACTIRFVRETTKCPPISVEHCAIWWIICCKWISQSGEFYSYCYSYWFTNHLILLWSYGNLINGNRDIKEHEWFKEVEWIPLLNQTINAPYVPNISNPEDISNFDKINDKARPKAKTMRHEDAFQDFWYSWLCDSDNLFDFVYFRNCIEKYPTFFSFFRFGFPKWCCPHVRWKCSWWGRGAFPLIWVWVFLYF